jgi:pectate lyase
VTDVLLHHNLFINKSQRNPQVSTAGLFDIRNNVISNWKSYGIRIRNGGKGNIVNNLFATRHNPEKAVILVEDGERSAGRVYVHGNRGPGIVNVNALSTAADPFHVAATGTDAVETVERKVLDGVGPVHRDATDVSLTIRSNLGQP